MSTTLAQLLLATVGVVLAASGAIVAWRTFLRSERWKQAEFLAREMKEFFDDERVQKALLMVDWGLRRVKLLEETAADKGYVKVDRQMQVFALRPHTLLSQGSDEESKGRFTREQAAIRDSYDALLDGFERFGNYLKTKLVQVENLDPYIGYWIEDLHGEAENRADAAWMAVLLTYIDFYRFRGVQHLFHAFGKPIDPASKAYLGFLAQMEDRELAARLAECVHQTIAPTGKAAATA